MRTNTALLAILPLFAFAYVCATAQEKIGGDIMFTPIEHATMVIQTKDKTIYVDSVGKKAQFAKFPNPDIILITHEHGDHFNADLVAALKTEKTVVIGNKRVIEKLKYGEALANDEETTVGGIRIEAVPAYNTTPDRTKFHPKGRDNGYVLNVDGQRIYISGDTENTEEMQSLKDIDFAFVSMNQPYTMTVEQAASAVLAMKPKAVTPYHCKGPGGLSDLDKFKRLVEEGDNVIEVRLLDWYGQTSDTDK